MTRTMKRHPSLHRDERGVALAIALLAIVLMGALVTGTFFAGRMEMSGGRNSIYNVQASEAAEAGITSAFASWSSSWNSYNVDVDNVQTAVFPISGNTSVKYTNTVRRLKGGTYLITSQGEKLDRNGNSLSTRLLTRMGKLVAPDVSIQAAVTAKSDVDINGAAFVDGTNFTPTGWNGCASYADKAAVRTLGTVGGNHSGSIAGATPVKIEHDGTVVDSIFQTPYTSFLSIKTLTIPDATFNGVAPSTTGSPATCNKADTSNWGEPRRTSGYITQCIDYFPVIYASAPSFRVNNTVGQGILLVAGDLDLHGNFNFYGLVIVQGGLTTTGTDNIYGAIMTNDKFVGDSDLIGGNVLAQYSGCAVAKAVAGSASGVALNYRNWAQVLAK